jgi:hypothetical protein
MSTEIESLELKISSNSTQAAQGIDALTQSLMKLKNATKGGLGLSSVATNIGKVAAATDKASQSNSKASASFTDLYHKLKTAASGFKLVGKAIYSAIQKSSSYTETINLFTVSMGEYAYEAQQYAETVSEKMGIDPAEWMQFQGTIMTLATGFGIAGDRASVMSQQLTQLAYDISSFREMSVGDAMLKVQSGFAGELEPLRAIGYDLSQARLAAIALELGIDKSVSSMTQAEKAQLRYYAIMTQVTSAQGDMARTLESPSNQLRVFKAQLNMAAREIGNIFIPALNAILPYAIAVVKVIRTLASTIASIVGFDLPEVDYSGVDSMKNAAEGTGDAMDEASKSAKKLKSYMLGFDELNVINPNEDSSSGGDDASDGFDFKLPEYNFLEGLANSRINDIVEDMKEWLGITEDIDTWSELLDTRLGSILKSVGLIGLGIAAWKVTKTFMDAISAINLLLSKPTYAIAIGITLAITGIVMSFDGMKSAIEDGLDGFNFSEIVGGAIVGTGGLTLLGSKIATAITKTFAGSKVATALTTAASKLGFSTVGAMGGAMGAAVSGIIFGIPAYFVGIYDACVEGIDWLSSLLIGAGATAAGAGIGAIIGMLGGPIGAGIGALIGLAVGLITDLVILIVQKWDEICAWFSEIGDWINTNVIQPVVGFFEGLWTSISGFFSNLWDDIVDIWNTVAGWFNKKVIQPVVNFFKGLWEDISGFFSNLWDGIVGIWNTVATWFDENVIQPIVSFFEGLTMRIGQFFEGCWIIIQAVWLIVSTWFNENVIIPVVEFFRGLWESISGFFTQLWADIVAIWELVSTWFNENVIIPVVEFFRGLWESITSFFTNLWEDIKALWNTVSTWFNENVVIPVVDFFKGLWESVTGFFTNLWEDIKEVWKDVCTWFDETIIEPVKTAFEKACDAISGFFSSLWLNIRRGIASAMNGVIGAIESTINWVIGGINNLIGGFNKVVQWAADVIGEDWGGVSLIQEVKFSRVAVPTYAEGGFPAQGQMFIAREAGAEMVGNIGRRTAVANNDQIVSGIAGGVAEANEEQNALLREQNSLLRALLDKDSGVYLDGKYLTNSVEKYQRERGRVLITGGVL